ncbi:MAG: prepilin peptidase [Endomicrobiales bacterium]|nr:prepilin peptidase [Endomicrobiales bacterium]
MEIKDIVFFIYIAACAYTDTSKRKVYNAVSFPAMAAGLLMGFLEGGLNGLKDPFFGICAGFLFLFAFYLFGGVGAGDVKFMMGAGSLLGAESALWGGFYGAAIAGIAAVFVLIKEKRFLTTLKQVFAGLYMLVTFKIPDGLKFDKGKTTFLPYAVFLSAGLAVRWFELHK